LTCANCGLENVAEGQHCSRCGHQSAPAAPAGAKGDGPAIVFGAATGVVVGPVLFVLLALLPSYGGIGERGIALSYLVETLVLALVIALLFTPFARLSLFFRVAGLTTLIIALGGLSICDLVIVEQVRSMTPNPAYTPAHR